MKLSSNLKAISHHGQQHYAKVALCYFRRRNLIMIKEAQSKQEKDIIGRYIKRITQKLTEQDALLLKYLS